MQRLRTRLRAGATAFPPATFALNFLTGALDSGVTFSRGSNATLVDSTGKITYAPANLVTYSEQFDNAAWIKYEGTVTANATTAPDGTTTADAYIESTTATTDHRLTFAGASAAVGQNLTLSVYAKANGRNFIALFSVTENKGKYFSIPADGTGAVLGDFGFAPNSAAISYVGNGWYRCSITYTATAASQNVRYYPCDTGATFIYTGNGTSGLFLWGAQLQPVTYQTAPSTYVATTTAAYYGPRFDYDPVTLAPKGLLIEEQRVNLLLYSEQFDNATWTKSAVTITANATAAPDGTSTADKLTPDVTLASHFAGQTVTTTAVAHTYSAYLKAGGYSWAILYAAGVNQGVYFDLANGVVGSSFIGAPTSSSITPVGNGWYRCSITFTATTGTAARVYASSANTVSTFAGDGTSGIFLWGSQLEAGAFATSYIPTVASQVTRSADVATMTGTNFSSWYNQTQGTLVSAFSSFSPTSASNAAWTISDETNSNRWFAFAVSSTIRSFMATGGVTQASIDVGTYAANTVFKSAFAISANSVQSAVNGILGTEDTAATVPTVVRLTVGASAIATTNFLNGHIRQIAYYNTRLPDATLQALTA
jgi:hypothetical protein